MCQAWITLMLQFFLEKLIFYINLFEYLNFSSILVYWRVLQSDIQRAWTGHVYLKTWQ